ncbi:MAG: M3 family metallopeptidase [Deinococcales bacterium]
MSASRSLADREAIPLEHTWHKEALFDNPSAWEVTYSSLSQELKKLTEVEGQLNNPDGISKMFKLLEGLQLQMHKLMVYGTMDYNCNSLDQEASNRHDRLRGLISRFQAATAFIEPELIAQGETKLRAWAQNDLSFYGHYLADLLRRSKHLRSAEVEGLLGDLGSAFAGASSAHGVLANSELDFGEALDSEGQRHTIGQGNIRQLLGSEDETLRQSAYEHYADAHLAFKQTMATLLATGVKQNLFNAHVKGHANALEAALAPDNIPSQVVYSLLDSFKAHLPLWHRYWQVKAKALGKAKLKGHDIFAPLGKSPKVTYEESVEWLGEALKPLGADYVRVLREGALNGRWVDRYPNKGKRMGAFSAGRKGTPPYIMMSYSDDVFGMSTLAHELGHSLHSYLSNEHQELIYARYSLFAAEVASNFNQAMLRAYLFELKTRQGFSVDSLIEELMANFYCYFLVMPT